MLVMSLFSGVWTNASKYMDIDGVEGWQMVMVEEEDQYVFSVCRILEGQQLALSQFDVAPRPGSQSLHATTPEAAVGYAFIHDQFSAYFRKYMSMNCLPCRAGVVRGSIYQTLDSWASPFFDGELLPVKVEIPSGGTHYEPIIRIYEVQSEELLPEYIRWLEAAFVYLIRKYGNDTCAIKICLRNGHLTMNF